MKKIIQHSFVQNFFILLVDRGFQFLSQLVTIFIITKYLGAVQFGYLMYAFTLFSVVYNFSNVGLEKTLVVELSNESKSSAKFDILVSGILIKLVASLLVYALVYFGQHSFLINFIDPKIYYVFVIYCLGVFSFSWILIDAFNQSISQVKLTAYARIIASIVSILFRLYLVYIHASLAWITLSFVIEQLICLLLCLIISKDFIAVFKANSIKHFQFKKHLIKSGFFVLISAVCFIIYFKSTQTVIERNLSHEFLGVFSLIMSLFEIPVSLAYILSTLFTPKIIEYFSKNNAESKTAIYGSFMFVFGIIGLASSGIILIFGVVLEMFLSNSYPNLFKLLLQGCLVIPIVFVGYCANMLLLISKKYKVYVLIAILNTLSIIVFWFFLNNSITNNNAAFYYLLTQLITSIIIPVLIDKTILKTVQHFLNLFLQPFSLISKLKHQLHPIIIAQ
jgi:O-antigen/teichoic acid export membrane protein